MSKSRVHVAGPGGGGSGGALLNFIGMHSWRSAFSHKASPSGISQPERPLHTYAPTKEKHEGNALLLNRNNAIIINKPTNYF